MISNKKMVAELVRLAEENNIPTSSSVLLPEEVTQAASTRPRLVFQWWLFQSRRYIHSPVSGLAAVDLEYAIQLGQTIPA